MVRQIAKGFFIAAGVLFLALGIIGVFLPVLPTTPFLLLAAACFFRGSDRFYHWLLHHKLFGSYIRNYRKYHAVTIRAKTISILALWLVISLSVYAVRSMLWLQITLLAIAVGVSVYLVSMRTLTREMMEDSKDRMKQN
ncbi:MAG: YbaN family protein [Chitinispirillaceae bacterium]|nr:YbaN family protein [Chitinispirillaceae bacterium]